MRVLREREVEREMDLKIPSVVIFLVFLSIFSGISHAAYCTGGPEEGERTNDYDIAASNLELVRAGSNAKLYQAGPTNARFNVLHLYGETGYETGLAQGLLMKREIKEFVYKTWGYLIKMVIDPEKFSPFMQAMILNKGFDKALDWTARVTAPYTPQAYFDELQGLADGSGVDYNMLLRINLFAELTKASCSFVGAWGSAVSNDNSYQLRALDYDTDGPFKDYPVLTVYHPTQGNHFAQVGWPGSIGALTGISSAQMAISEIGVSFADDSFGQGTENTPPEKVHGKPWMYVLRDVLQYSTTLEEGIKSIQESNRTCNLIIGLGDGKEGYVNGIQYSGYVANPYDDETLLPVNDTWHPQIQNVVYNGMDWNCPTYTSILGEQLQKYHGKIDANTIYRYILPTVQTGNLHIAITDLTDMQYFLSFARASTADESEPFNAYERQFTQIDMKVLFEEKLE